MCVYLYVCTQSSVLVTYVQRDPEAGAMGDQRGVMCIQWSVWILIQHFFLPVEWVCVRGEEEKLGWSRMEGRGGPDAPPRTVACLGDILLYMPI